MIYLWIGLGLWLLPAAILGIVLTAIVIDDKLKDKPYHHPVTWFILALLVALGALTAFTLMNS